MSEASQEGQGVRLRVLFFASLREAVGLESVELNLADGSFAHVREALIDRLGTAAEPLWAENVRLARNQELLNDREALDAGFSDGDELAFLPPVTGG